jgi:hypothetical protein
MPARPGGLRVMPPKNPWYLITSDEIDTIREYLQGMSGAQPGVRKDRAGEVLLLLDHVRERRP